jgi:hypothetical protein
MVSPATDALMLLSAAGVIGLAAASVVQVVRGRRSQAARLAAVGTAVVLAYGAVLVGAGLASHPRQLAAGDAKCFDDWCAALVAARHDATAGAWLVDVELGNHGRGRAMRSNLARAYLEVPGQASVAPADGRPLQTLLQPGERVDVHLVFPAPRSQREVRFLVSEADGLGIWTFEIGAEGSPFHARAGWPLTAGGSSAG